MSASMDNACSVYDFLPHIEDSSDLSEQSIRLLQ